LACAAVSLLLGLTQGLGVNLIAANLPALQGALGATPTEANWLLTAYYAVSVSAALLLVKFRQQYGLRLFVDLGLGLFVVVTIAHLFVNDLRSAIAVRAAQGLAAAPLSTLTLFYMIEAFPASKRGMGMALGVGALQIALPLSRVIAPDLLQIGQWRGLLLPEAGLALISLAAVNFIRLTPVPRVQVFDRLDVVAFAILAPALGLFCVVLSQGRVVWWTEAPWLGVCLALAIALLTLAAVIEMNRSHPLIDFRWLAQADMLRLAAAIVLFRIVLSEQSVGAVGFLQAMGLTIDQMAGLYWRVLAATAAGFFVAALTMKPELARPVGLAALLLIAAGAWIDSHVTSVTRPPQLYLSQSLMAFAGALFLPGAMLAGITRATQKGPTYIASFIVVFSGGQNLGGLFGSGLLGSFVVLREKFHSNQLTESLTLADPLVAARLRQLAGTYARVLGDVQLRTAEGGVLLARAATTESYALAYQDLFRLIAFLALATFAWFFFVEIRHRLRTRAAQAAVAGAA